MIDELTDTLATMVRRYESAKGETRSALARKLARTVADVESERDELVAWLVDKEGWFTRNPNSSRVAERTDAWIAVLDRYAALTEAVAEAEAAMGVASPAAIALTVTPRTAEWSAWAERVKGSWPCL